MLKFKNDLKDTTESNSKGEVKLFLSNLAEFETKNEKLRTFALAKLRPGEEVEFHVHENECEYYYIISGSGIYDDNGTKIEVTPGTVTYTPSGSGHGLKNKSSEILEFIALIILD